MNKFIHGNNMSGQSIVDRALAARHTVAGQSLAKVICKATTEELMGPKRKHLDYLIQCTNEPNISIPQMANLLIDRTQNSSWVVVFKALVTVHNLMNYGNERFTQFLASNHCSFHLSNFHDNTNNQSYEMSSYIRRHSKYLNEKAVSYRQMAVDFCKVKRGKEDGLLRTMDTDKLLKSLPVLQVQLDSLVEFNASSRDLSNGIINSAFLLLFKDLIRLFACYNDGIINLLEKYFDMNKKNCKEALEIYKRFLARMDRVCEVLKVAENIGIDKGDIPDLAKAPSSLLEALEQHLSYMENNKKVVSNKPTAGLTAVINNYAAASQAGNALGAGADEITEEERKKILDEEQRQLDLLKKERMKQMSPAASSTSSNTSGKAVDPFAPSSTPTTTTTTMSTTKIATASTAAATTAAITTSSHITDLLSLNNTPPALFSSPQQQQQQQDLFSQQEFFSQQPPQQQDLFSQQPSQQLSFFPQQQQQSQQLFTQQNLFGAPNTFQTAFPTSQPQQQQPQQFSPQQQQNLPLNPFLPQQQPLFNFQQQQQQQSWLPPSKQQNDTFNNAFNPIQQQQQQQQPPPSTNIMPPPMQPPSTTLNMQAPPSSTTTTPKHPTKLIHSDLDSSLASLAGSLSFSPVGQLKKVEHQWTGGGPERKMTGANHGNNQWGFNAASTTTNNAWATPYSTSMAAQRNANMSPFQVNQPRPMTQSAGGVWGSTPHLQSANQVSKPTSLDQSNNPFGLL